MKGDKTQGLLEFCIEAQRSVTELQQRLFPLPEMRSQSEKYLEKNWLALNTPPAGNTGGAVALAKFVKKGNFAQAPECILEPEFFKRMAPKNECPGMEAVVQSCETTKPEIAACMLPPGFWLREHWTAHEEPLLLEFAQHLARRNALFLRTGFLSSEFEVHESVLMGFRGIVLYATLLDEFQIQFLTEVCRDFKTCLVWAVDSEETLKRVLKTDAPYLSIAALPNEKGERNLSFLQKMIPKIPNTCPRVAVLPGAKPHEVSYAQAAGYACVVGSV